MYIEPYVIRSTDEICGKITTEVNRVSAYFKLIKNLFQFDYF
jgi:hypothetical protein